MQVGTVADHYTLDEIPERTSAKNKAERLFVLHVVESLKQTNSVVSDMADSLLRAIPLVQERHELKSELDRKREQLADGVKTFLAEAQRGMSKRDVLFLTRLLTEIEDKPSITRRIGKFRSRERVNRVRLIRNSELARELKVTPSAITQRINSWAARNPQAWDFVKEQRQAYMEAWKLRDTPREVGGKAIKMVEEGKLHRIDKD